MANRVKIEFKKRDIALKNVPKFYQTLAENKMSIGVHKREGLSVGTTDKPNRANILERAYFNEFGTRQYVSKTFRKKSQTDGKMVVFQKGDLIVVPPRPFVRLYLYPNRLEKVMVAYVNFIDNSFLHGLKSPVVDARETLKYVARIAEEEMQSIIGEKVELQPNSAFTVYLKGFDYPLVETGRLLYAIKGKVEKR